MTNVTIYAGPRCFTGPSIAHALTLLNDARQLQSNDRGACWHTTPIDVPVGDSVGFSSVYNFSYYLWDKQDARYPVVGGSGSYCLSNTSAAYRKVAVLDAVNINLRNVAECKRNAAYRRGVTKAVLLVGLVAVAVVVGGKQVGQTDDTLCSMRRLSAVLGSTGPKCLTRRS